MTRSIIAQWTVVPAAVLAMGLGSAHAQDVFSACFKINGSKVRNSSELVNATPICKPTETLHSWNQEGPPGPPGAPGFSDCGPEELTGSCNANTFAVLNLSCSAGKKAVSAGAIWHTPFDAADNGPFYYFPRDADTWTVVPWNHTGVLQEFRFFLQCCS